MRIVLTGGGTGGHVAPFAPVIEALRSVYPSERAKLPGDREPGVLSLYFCGVSSPETRAFFDQYDVRTIHIPSGKLRRYAAWQTIPDLLLKLPLGILQALVEMWRLMPDAVISKGGYGSVPVVLAAAFYRIPILLHESDVVPGLANRISARSASLIAVGFDTDQFTGALQKKAVVTGVPVSTQFGLVDRAEARRVLGVPLDALVLLIVGGSQGAHQLNELVLAVLPSLITDMAIIHVTGQDHAKAVTTVAAELLATSPQRTRYRPYGYLTDTMQHAYIAADTVVARAGATTLAELARLKKPTLLVPLLQAAGDHQRKNAAYFEQRGAARVLDPNNLTPHLFERSVRDIILNEQTRRELAERMARLDHPEAARTLATLLFNLASGYKPTYRT